MIPVLKKQYFFFLLLLVIFCFSNCKKKIDSAAEITIISPIENSNYSVLDTVYVEAQISDDETIKNVHVSIVQFSGNNEITIDYGKIETASSDLFHLKTSFVISNKTIISDAYYLKIAVQEQEQTTNAFVKITINELAKKRVGLIVLCQNPGSDCNIFSLTNNLNAKQILQTNSNFTQSAVNSNEDMFFMVSNPPFNLNYYSIDTTTILTSSWTYQMFPYNSLSEGWCDVTDNLIFVSSDGGKIIGFDESTTERKSAFLADQSYYVKYFTKISSNWAVFAKKISAPGRVEIINYETGISSSFKEIDFEVIKIFPYYDDKIIIWGNKNNIAKVCTLSVASNILYEIPDIQNEPVKDAICINTGEYLYAAGNSIYLYEPLYKNSSIFIDNIDAQLLEFDKINNEVLTGAGTTFSSFHYPDGELLFSVNFTDTIRGINIWYNKD